MRISIVTDELSNDPATAFEIGLEWGIREFELRGVFDRRVPRIEPHLRRGLVRSVRDFGVTVPVLSPGLFKIGLPAGEPNRSNLGWMDASFDLAWSQARTVLADHLDNLLPRTLDLAAELGASQIIAFSFARGADKTDAIPQAVVEALARAAELAAAAGIRIAVETEEGHWANTGRRTAALVEAVSMPNLGINWDPANALIDGDLPYPTGYEAVREHVFNVHFKDVAVAADGSWTIVEQGGVDWAGEITALLRDGYAGAIAIEPHLSPSVAVCRRSLARLRGLIEAGHAAVRNFSTG